MPRAHHAISDSFSEQNWRNTINAQFFRGEREVLLAGGLVSKGAVGDKYAVTIASVFGICPVATGGAF